MKTTMSKSVLVASMLLVSLLSVGGTAAPETKVDLVGTWILTIETPMGISNPILRIQKSADGYVGTY